MHFLSKILLTWLQNVTINLFFGYFFVTHKLKSRFQLKIICYYIWGWPSSIWPNRRFLIEKPVAGKAIQKNDLSKASIIFLYTSNIFFYRRIVSITNLYILASVFLVIQNFTNSTPHCNFRLNAFNQSSIFELWSLFNLNQSFFSKRQK